MNLPKDSISVNISFCPRPHPLMGWDRDLGINLLSSATHARFIPTIFIPQFKGTYTHNMYTFVRKPKVSLLKFSWLVENLQKTWRPSRKMGEKICLISLMTINIYKNFIYVCMGQGGLISAWFSENGAKKIPELPDQRILNCLKIAWNLQNFRKMFEHFWTMLENSLAKIPKKRSSMASTG